MKSIQGRNGEDISIGALKILDIFLGIQMVMHISRAMSMLKKDLRMH